jgi:hypothetical protein
MTVTDWTIESTLGGRGCRYHASAAGAPRSVHEVLGLLHSNAAFRQELVSTIAACPYLAFRWEMPPLTHAKMGRPFEFVLADDPYLADMAPEPDVFAPYFEDAPPGMVVRAVPNLRRTAQLVVPRGLVDDSVYGHLGAFLRAAPREQVHALWACVAQTVVGALSQAPLWVSTAGGGVAWLHVRVEGSPTYYTHRPYAIER